MKEILLGALIVSLMMAAASSLAGVWQDNFDDGKADGWDETGGKWEIKDGMYQQTDVVAEYQSAILEVEDLTDYIIEVDVTVLEGGPGSTSIAAGVLLRADDTGSNGYRFWIRPDQNGFQFSTWQDNQYTHVVTNAAEKAELGGTYRLKVQLEGFTISAWVDDRLMVDEHVDESQLFPSGRIALINYNAHCQYDNLTITGENVASNLSIAPAGKLAIVWGAVKTMS